MNATAVIAAAGSGQRLGAGGPKAFVELAGRPLLGYSIDACAAASSITALIVAAPAGSEDRAAALLESSGLAGEVVTGGATRADSVRAALAVTSSELVLVHDAARPLAPAGLWDAIVARLQADPGAGGVIAATPVADTIKKTEGGSQRVSGTVPREGLWAAQTPQGFRTEALRSAQEKAEAAGTLAAATDEAMLIELAGGTVLLEQAPATNLKVTTADDLRIAEALLSA